MPSNKNQHYVPKCYFKLFSENNKTICTFNISNSKFIPHASIKGQCSKAYFYSKDTDIEKTFSNLEGIAVTKLRKIIRSRNLNCLSNMEKAHLRSHILFQHGRTKFAYDREEDMANYMFNLFKPTIYEKAKKEGKNFSWELINNMKIKLKSSYSLITSMLSGILLYDLNMILLENKSNIDFIFSDNPVVLFNSFFNDSHPYGTTGLANTGLQLFYPINSKLMILLYDSNFYELSPKEVIQIYNPNDIQRLNGLQIINCDKNIYFGNEKLKEKYILKYEQLKSKRPNEKNEYEIMGTRIAEDGTKRELLRTSSPKIKYNLRKLSFLKHKKTSISFGIRDKHLVEIDKKIWKEFKKGNITSVEDFDKFFT